jgi:hypothetical protein
MRPTVFTVPIKLSPLHAYQRLVREIIIYEKNAADSITFRPGPIQEVLRASQVGRMGVENSRKALRG